MPRSFRALFIGVIWAGTFFTSLDAFAASLREILEKEGRDYVLANAKTIAAQVDDRDRYFLARILIANLRGSEAPEILIPLAQRGGSVVDAYLGREFWYGKRRNKDKQASSLIVDV